MYASNMHRYANMYACTCPCNYMHIWVRLGNTFIFASWKVRRKH